MSITINLEIGHDASLRTKTTPEGFTHDWEVFVKGCNGAEIHHYVEKVVFHLHETFPRPKRVIKEPPYSLRTSGYAGFNLPIEIYLRNNQEPKKIKFNYDLQLQPTGPPIHRVQKEKYVFNSPSEEFKSRLLKGGGIVGSSGSGYDIHESKVSDEKNQMTSKPKFSGSEIAKKHKIKLDEPRNTDFVNLFGTPITKTTSKTSEVQKPKDVSKSSLKPEKPVEKDKTKPKNPHKDKEKEKSKDKDKSSDSSEKRKEEKKKSKEDKNRDRERSKEKSSKKDKERDKSPAIRPRSPSPKRSPKRTVTPPPPSKHNSSKDKDQSKEEKKEKERKEDKKNKKEKREHKDSKHKDKDRDKDKEHKEHKSRESKSSKESSGKEKDVSPVPAPTPAAVPVASSQPSQKTEKKTKEKDPPREIKEEEKPEKPRQEKSEDKQKHKHKKKDRKEKREDKYSKSEKKPEKPSNAPAIKDEPKEAPPVSSTRDTDKSNLFGSPKSDPPSTPNQTEQKPEKPSNNVAAFREDETSNDSNKISSRDPSPAPRAPSKSPSLPPAEPVKKPEPEKKKEELPKKKEKKEKKKDKKADKDHEKRRKRKSPATHIEAEQPPEKVLKEEENNNSDDERKVSSTEDANPIPKNEAEDYMGMLRDLQHKIMGLKDNSDLQKVVQLIAETGRYEVSAHTFDFDLCLLDRSTVRQLQDFFSSIS